VACQAQRSSGAFRVVSPNYRFALFNTIPNDPYLGTQWYINDGGFADIRLPAAWDVERGSSRVRIVIMDTGVDLGHPDLASKIWTNTGEIPGNGIDDDGNGFIDDVHGWDFGRGDNDPNPEYIPEYVPELGLDVDVGFHGTFCAGIAAAANDNGEGIAGAGWNCQILPLKVAHPDSGITSVAIAGAFAYATDQNAEVISMSFGGPGDPGVPEFFQALVDDATGAGSVCVAAAGNDGASTPTYPAACDKVLAVGATDDSNARASFSNFGSWVDVAAPGSLMWSSIARNYELTDTDQAVYIVFFGWDGTSPYMYGDGTSFACPLVAGVCGLVRSRFPALSPAQVAQQLIQTGDVVAYDEPIGPRVNAYQAVTSAPVAVDMPGAGGRWGLTAITPNPSGALSTIRFALAAEGPARLRLYDAGGRLVRELASGRLPAGEHVAAWDGRDGAGREAPSGLYFLRLECDGRVARAKLVRITR